jgi:Zn-dependent alcohol dehydrogenase
MRDPRASLGARPPACPFRERPGRAIMRLSPAGQEVSVKAAIYQAAHQPLTIEDIDIIDPRPGEILVRTVCSGVCHSDLHFVDGAWSIPMPTVLGHEAAGVVEKVGAGVTYVAKGDHVIMSFIPFCGSCYFCVRGQPHLCNDPVKGAQAATRLSWKGKPVLQFANVGSFSEYMITTEKGLVKIPNEMPMAEAALIGCGVMTGIGAALYTAEVRPGSSVAVFGCGGVGDSVIQGAKLAGATTIIAVDLDPQKLEWAKGFGATHTINASEGDPVEQIKNITGGNGVNYSFEAVGISQTLEQALWCRDLAGTCVLIGVPGPGPRLDIDMQQLFDLGGALKPCWYGDCLPTRDFPLLATWYEQGQLNLDDLVSRKITLEETEEAFEAMKRGETLRSVIMFD